jgi:hypothetical protein
MSEIMIYQTEGSGVEITTVAKITTVAPVFLKCTYY